MTRLLASVVRPDEAGSAARSGADVVQLSGQSGPETSPRLAALVAEVAGAAETSAAVARTDPRRTASMLSDLADLALDRATLAVRPGEALDALGATFRDAPPRLKLIAGLAAGSPIERHDLARLRDWGFSGIHVATDSAGAPRLLDRMSIAAIGTLIADAQAEGLEVGLQGRLEAPDVPRLAALGADLLCFDDALVGRDGRVDEETVAAFKALMATPQASATGSSPGTDRIFVREFELPVSIGAYESEHGRTQRVRFDVEAEVVPPMREPEHIGDVVSYDLILDAIRMSVASGHVVLSEALAERIARSVLAEPRVISVRVKVEKLDLGPAGIGVEIVRRR